MKRFALALAAFVVSASSFALDHNHGAWDLLLKKHVKYVQGGNASRVDYAGFAKDRAQLKSVLDEYQKATRAEFDTWAKPQLRNEAFTPEKAEAQLEDEMRRFLSDRTRNRYNPQTRKLEISRIFDWYGKDFEKGHKGFSSVKATLAKYADLLADKPEERAVVKGEKADVSFLDYDWSLNDAK